MTAEQVYSNVSSPSAVQDAGFRVNSENAKPSAHDMFRSPSLSTDKPWRSVALQVGPCSTFVILMFDEARWAQSYTKCIFPDVEHPDAGAKATRGVSVHASVKLR